MVSTQNGIPWWYGQGLGQGRPAPPDLSRLDPGGALARAVEPRRVIGGVVYSSNEVIEPGVIEGFNPGAEHLVLGEPGDGESEGSSEIFDHGLVQVVTRIRTRRAQS